MRSSRPRTYGSPIPTIPLRQEPLPAFKQYEQPVIAHTKVRYVGEPMAVVVADTAAIAEDALELIQVDIESLPAVADRSSARSDKVVLFEAAGTNLTSTLTAVKGDADAAFARAAYTRRERFQVQRFTAVPMESRGFLAEWDAGSGRLTLCGAAKVAFPNRRILAKQMGLPEQSIRMVENDVGGAFGVRGEFYPEDFLIPFAARLLGRPVKWIEDRREHLLATNHARDVECELEIACERDGTILGLRGQAYADIGAYIRTNGATAARNVAQVMSGPYSIPNIHVAISLLVTNKTPVGTYRGPGRFEADFFRERLLDMAAKDLGLDRTEFRRRNLISEAEMPYSLAKVIPLDMETETDNGDYVATLDRCLDEIGWTKKAGLRGKLIDGRYHGMAVGCYLEGGASGPRENARMQLEADGTVSVFVGSSAVGQGVETVFAQIAADALEMPMDRIKGVFHGSTDFVSRRLRLVQLTLRGDGRLRHSRGGRQIARRHPRSGRKAPGLRGAGDRHRQRYGGRAGPVIRGAEGARWNFRRRNLCQQQAHLQLWRARRPCHRRSENRPGRGDRLRGGRGCRPYHQSGDPARPVRGRDRAGPRRRAARTTGLRRERPAADRIARRLPDADRERLRQHPRHCAGGQARSRTIHWAPRAPAKAASFRSAA